eukprot:362822-Chlamydomonas_euryale.AAC.15
MDAAAADPAVAVAAAAAALGIRLAREPHRHAATRSAQSLPASPLAQPRRLRAPPAARRRRSRHCRGP